MKTKKIYLIPTLFFLLSLFYFNASISAQSKNDKGMTGRDIVKKSEDLPTPDSAEVKMLMKINYSGDKVVEKEFELISKKNFQKGKDGVLMEFTKPSKIKVLSHSIKDADNDQWIKLSSGNPKRTAEIGREKSFVGSHFCYEDLAPRKIDDFDYKYIGDKKINNFDCYIVEAVSKKGDMVYDKTLAYIRKSDYFPVRMELFQKGELFKYVEMYDIKEIQGIITPHKIAMYRADGSGKTELIIKDGYPKYNIKIKDREFDPRSL